jgi:hypothetical protein
MLSLFHALPFCLIYAVGARHGTCTLRGELDWLKILGELRCPRLYIGATNRRGYSSTRRFCRIQSPLKCTRDRHNESDHSDLNEIGVSKISCC